MEALVDTARSAPPAWQLLPRTLSRHSPGGGQLNLGRLPFGGHALQNYYRQGWFYGAGIGYGYQWSIAHRWKLEAGIGLGYTRFDYEEYGCPICGGKLGEGSKNYWGVTKLNFSLIYVLPLNRTRN